jgi:hypothetical protein
MSDGGVMARRVTWRRPDRKYPPDAISIKRGTKWGNPYEIGTEGVPDNATAVRLHHEWFLHSDEVLTYRWGKGFRRADPIWQRANLPSLRGCDLACNCQQGEPCHGDLLLKLANSRPAAPSPLGS